MSNIIPFHPIQLLCSYATGLFFVSPLGDILKRRQLILALIFASASLTVGFALTSSLLVIQILAFFIGLSTIALQIIIALTRILLKVLSLIPSSFLVTCPEFCWVAS